jgi:hypothetical protein
MSLKGGHRARGRTLLGGAVAVAVACLAAFLTGATALSATAAPDATAASQVEITNCNHAQSRPKEVTLTCADGNTVLRNLHWSSFGGLTAAARGTFEVNTCTPNCAEGRMASYTVQLRATRPGDCSGTLRVYHKLTLVFIGTPPKAGQSLSHWTLGCPS